MSFQMSLLAFFKGHAKTDTVQKSPVRAGRQADPALSLEKKNTGADVGSKENGLGSLALIVRHADSLLLAQRPSRNKDASVDNQIGQIPIESAMRRGAPESVVAAQGQHNDGPAMHLPNKTDDMSEVPHDSETFPSGVLHKGKAKELNISGTKRKRVEMPGPLEDLETDLERQRADNIRRNEEFLASLGIESSFLAPKKRQAATRPKHGGKAVASGQVPVRRSTRARGITAEGNQSLMTSLPVSAKANLEDEESAPLHYDDSSVRKYTCKMQGEGITNEDSDSGTWEMDSFQPVSASHCDPLMTRVYALDATEGAGGRLLAAGGHAGRLAVFGLARAAEVAVSHCASEGTPGDWDSDLGQEAAEGPLLAWKGGSGWISAVQFLTQQQREEATLLLTSSNDRSVVLWDIDKSNSATKTPRIVAKTSSLHSNGIFGMHELGGQIATASKDKTVGITAVTDAGLSPVTVLSGHHGTAVRAVHFRDTHHLADGSADCSVAISDLRLADPGALCLEAAHESAINVVLWHPTNEHLLMSASHDRELRLHDIRAPEQPLFTFVGHLGPRLHRSKGIYRPSFLGTGRYIACPGEGSEAISLYDVASGKAVSRGRLGCDATMTMAGSMGRHLWVAAQGGVVRMYQASLSVAA